jgi:hypothetical protein
MKHSFFKELEELFTDLKGFLNNYERSNVLQNYLFEAYKSSIYSILIQNFFSNLTQKNIVDSKLPKGKIGIISKRYEDVKKDINSSLKFSQAGKRVDVKYYRNFKLRIKEDFPEFLSGIDEIEKVVDYKRIGSFLKEKRKELKKTGEKSCDTDITTTFTTKVLEEFVAKKKYFPYGEKLSKLTESLVLKVAPIFSDGVIQTLKKNSRKMLKEQRRDINAFEKRLYEGWREPIDLLECLIRISLESGVAYKERLSKNTDYKNPSPKTIALINIHGRALQIANEILTLLKSGYADGASARWRSLHELAVISFFLKAAPDEVSNRYLEHDIIKRCKDAKDYKTYYRKLGYAPLGRRTFGTLSKLKDQLCKKYDDGFESDYGWIPKSIMKDRNFRKLEEEVKLDAMHPFYNRSCHAVHGGSRGFYRLGLMEHRQNELLLAGPSNYGLADPFQNTAMSLVQVTVCLLNLNADFEGIIQMQIMLKYITEIANKAVKIQKDIEKKENVLSRYTKR